MTWRHEPEKPIDRLKQAIDELQEANESLLKKLVRGENIVTWKHPLEKRVVKWEFVPRGLWYVVEHNGMLRTGPFRDKSEAREWFRKELDVQLEESNEG